MNKVILVLVVILLLEIAVLAIDFHKSNNLNKKEQILVEQIQNEKVMAEEWRYKIYSAKTDGDIRIAMIYYGKHIHNIAMLKGSNHYELY